MILKTLLYTFYGGIIRAKQLKRCGKKIEHFDIDDFQSSEQQKQCKAGNKRNHNEGAEGTELYAEPGGQKPESEEYKNNWNNRSGYQRGIFRQRDQGN